MLIQKYEEGDLVTDYCRKIASFLGERDIKTHLVCFGDRENDEEKEHLTLHEFPYKLHGDNYFSWSMLIQSEFLRKIREVVDGEDIDLFHANDWLTVPAVLSASNLFEKPFLVTFHSTEEERGMEKPNSGQISHLEYEGADGSAYTIVHNETTREALKVFDLPKDKVKFLDGNNWKDNLFELYKQVEKVSDFNSSEAEKNENFDAYVGVPSE